MQAEPDISTLNLIADDQYRQLAIVFDKSPLGTGSSFKKTRFIRWDGTRFNEIWRHDLVSRDGGNRGGVPHDYVANLEFSADGNGNKKINVVSLYATRPTGEEVRTQRALEEEFAWSEQDRRFILVRKREQVHEKGKNCYSITEPGRKDIIQCYSSLPAFTRTSNTSSADDASSLQRSPGFSVAEIGNLDCPCG